MNDFTAIQRVYDCAFCEVHRHRIRHEHFSVFCLELQHLQNALGESAEDAYWRPILQCLCRFRYLASASPVSFNDAAIFSPQNCSDIGGLLSSRGRYLYPDLSAQALTLLSLHQEIAATATNPVADAITELLTKESAILVREAGLVTRTERVMTGLGRPARVLAPSHLKGLACLDHLIVVGPTRWYPEYVFSAPRAQRIEILQYAWMRDRKTEFISFLAQPFKTQRRTVLMYQDDPEEVIDADIILPAVNWQQIVQTARATEDQNQDEVDARLFVLDGDRAVFLEADEQATARIIDVKDEKQPVQRVPVTELTTGMFVLLRTTGAGDYIVPIADRFLGANAETVRAQRRWWKQKLRDLVRAEGISVVVSNLRDNGSRIASETNVRTWMAERSIKTAAYEDFSAIIKLIGEETRAGELWNAMCLIDHAHRRAGFHISKLLLKQVKAANLGELEQHGTLEFTLPEEEGGSITAFRIEQIAPDVYRIPVTRLGHVFRM